MVEFDVVDAPDGSARAGALARGDRARSAVTLDEALAFLPSEAPGTDGPGHRPQGSTASRQRSSRALARHALTATSARLRRSFRRACASCAGSSRAFAPASPTPGTGGASRPGGPEAGRLGRGGGAARRASASDRADGRGRGGRRRPCSTSRCCRAAVRRALPRSASRSSRGRWTSRSCSRRVLAIGRRRRDLERSEDLRCERRTTLRSRTMDSPPPRRSQLFVALAAVPLAVAGRGAVWSSEPPPGVDRAAAPGDPSRPRRRGRALYP